MTGSLKNLEGQVDEAIEYARKEGLLPPEQKRSRDSARSSRLSQRSGSLKTIRAIRFLFAFTFGLFICILLYGGTFLDILLYLLGIPLPEPANLMFE